MTDEELAGQVKSEAVQRADALVVEAIKALRALPYADYLRTQHWLDFREGILKLHPVCQQCNAANSVQVHHSTYNYLGREREGDVWALCANCHQQWHDEHRSERLSTPPDDVAWAGMVRRFGQL